MATTYKQRTREEVIDWFRKVRQRKEIWEKETEAELKAMSEERLRAQNSHYYDFVM